MEENPSMMTADALLTAMGILWFGEKIFVTKFHIFRKTKMDLYTLEPRSNGVFRCFPVKQIWLLNRLNFIYDIFLLCLVIDSHYHSLN